MRPRGQLNLIMLDLHEAFRQYGRVSHMCIARRQSGAYHDAMWRERVLAASRCDDVK